MTSPALDQVARAVLYEGYLLYPYRPSALKNQQRWNFGVLYPPSWSASQTGSDRSYFQMECIAEVQPGATLDISLRFLQLLTRSDTEREWQEGSEQTVDRGALSIAEIAERPCVESFSFPGGKEESGNVVREKVAVCGLVEVSAEPVQAGAVRLTVRARNTTSCNPESRNDALLHSLASAHVALQVHNARFASQVDPPEDLRAAVTSCQNTGVWPVLIGDKDRRDIILGSPIILYDFPEVAPESKADLFDATEIDEILILRILTLSDSEKEELRRSDDRARRLLERLENSSPEHLLELHGTIRSCNRSQNAWSAWDTVDNTPRNKAAIDGIEIKRGDRVILRPRNRADIFDTLLEGRLAVIESIEEDFEGNIHFAVVLEDDPGRDLGEMRQAGHRFFFLSEEVERLSPLATERP